MRRLVIITLTLALVGSACDSGPDTRVCTQIGCSDMVAYLIDDSVTAAWPTPLEVTVCVDEHCVTNTVAEGEQVHRALTRINLTPGTLDRDDRHDASLVVVDGSGATLLAREDVVTLRTEAPNGVDCGPVCGVAAIVVTSEG